MKPENLEIAKKITERIENATNILVVSSRPVDPDSLGTGLALKWWIKEKFEKEVESVIFGSIPPKLKDFPDLKKIKVTYADKIDWEIYDLIILLDSSSWDLLLGKDSKDVISLVGLDTFVSIDHHKPDKLHTDLKDSCLRVDDICTAKILYDYFIKPSGIELTKEIATAMYMSLIDDSRFFKNEAFPGMYGFAEILLQAGAEHDRAVNVSIDMDSMKFLDWAIENTEYIEDIETSLLVVDTQKYDEISEIFGDNWKAKGTFRYYFESVMRVVDGYNYGLFISIDPKHNSVWIAWRTRNYGENVSIQRVLEKIGFEAGGHFGSGGAKIFNSSIKEVRENVISEMKKALNNKGDYQI